MSPFVLLFLSLRRPNSRRCMPVPGLSLCSCSSPLAYKQVYVFLFLNKSVFIFNPDTSPNHPPTPLSLQCHSFFGLISHISHSASGKLAVRSSSDLLTNPRGFFSVFPTPKHPATFTVINSLFCSFLWHFPRGILSGTSFATSRALFSCSWMFSPNFMTRQGFNFCFCLSDHNFLVVVFYLSLGQ